MTLKYAAAITALLLFPTALSAQEEMRAAPKCDAMVAPPPALAGWSSKADVAAATKADGLSAAALTVNHGATVALTPEALALHRDSQLPDDPVPPEARLLPRP